MATGLHNQVRNGCIGPPTWPDAGLLITGAEQYVQRKNICNDFSGLQRTQEKKLSLPALSFKV